MILMQRNWEEIASYLGNVSFTWLSTNENLKVVYNAVCQ
jgi:hypothetical protein